MHETTIQAREAQRTGADLLAAEVKGRVENIVKAANGWLDRRSAFYTRVAGFEVTNRTVCRVNGITVCIIAGVMAVEAAPVTALAMMAMTWWLTKRLNAADSREKESEAGSGSDKQAERKGGMR